LEGRVHALDECTKRCGGRVKNGGARRICVGSLRRSVDLHRIAWPESE
jgi:hypothetical protein